MTFPSQSKYLLIGQETPGTSGATSAAAFGFGSWLAGTAGTATPNDVGLVVTDVTDTSSREVIESSGISRIQVQKITSGIVDDGISFGGDFQHGRLFKYIVGVGTTNVSGSDVSHGFKISQSPPAASIQSGNNLTTDSILKHVGQFIESAELGIVLNENLKLKVVFKGKTSNSGTTAPTAIISTLPVFQHALCEVKINGTAATEVQNSVINVAKTIVRSGGVGSNIYQQGHGTELKFAFSASLGFTDNTFQELFMGDTVVTAGGDPTAFDFAITADNNIAFGSGQRRIEFVLENCIMNSFSQDASVGGLTFLTLSGVGTFKSLNTVDNISNL